MTSLSSNQKNIALHTYDTDSMNTMFRDLAEYESLNVKELLLQYRASEQKNTQKHKKKAELIKQQNILNKQNKAKADDIKRLEHFSNISTITPEIIEELKIFSTDYGKERLKFKLLELAVKNEDLDNTVELYLQIIHSDTTSKVEEKLKAKVLKLMKNLKYKEYQFTHLSNRLPPLDFYNDRPKKLEPWQVEVLTNIDKGNNTLVCAKTSMGKTWLAMYPPLKNLKTLFIVPTKPLAYQVASVFMKFLDGKTSLIVKDYFLNTKNSLVLVGTPTEIEKNLPDIGIDFDFVVADEIHNLNNYDGDCYERLLKLFLPTTQFLALSATIGNSNELQDWFRDISIKDVKLIQYSTRFLNHQRHIVSSNSLEKIHPFSCVDFEDIDTDFMKKNLPLTPVDNVKIYKAIRKEFDKDFTKDINLENVFSEDNKRLTLDDSKLYEDILKKKIVELKDSHPERLKKILSKFQRDVEVDVDVNLYKLFENIKKMNMTPCILFQLNSDYCKEIFQTIVGYLEKIEALNHPYYYDNLEYLHEYYVKYTDKYDKFVKGIKLSKDSTTTSSMSKDEQKERIIRKFENTELQTYLNDIQSRVQKQLKTIQQNDSISEKVKCIQYKNLSKSLEEILDTDVIKDYDQFMKHPDFCMNHLTPMTAQTIRTIKKDIQNNLHITVEYTNVFIQGLKRGVGIYTEDMPEIYNQHVQALAQSKQLGFVVSDRTLGLGINMPFRSTCILGYKDSTYFSKNDYDQFIGRAGRRGFDNEGHIIYCNVDWKTLMKGELGVIKGQSEVYYDYNVLSHLTRQKRPNSHERNTKITESTTNNVFTKFLNSNVIIEQNNIKRDFYADDIENIILWRLKEYKNRTRLWIANHDKLQMMYKKDITSVSLQNFLEILIYIFKISPADCHFQQIDFTNISMTSFYDNYMAQYKKGKFSDNIYIKTTYELINIIQELYNIYIQHEDNVFYTNLMEILKNLFLEMQIIINRNQSLN